MENKDKFIEKLESYSSRDILAQELLVEILALSDNPSSREILANIQHEELIDTLNRGLSSINSITWDEKQIIELMFICPFDAKSISAISGLGTRKINNMVKKVFEKKGLSDFIIEYYE